MAPEEGPRLGRGAHRLSEPPAIPAPPEKPDDTMCCQRGCCPCIFDYYDDALARWKDRLRELGLDENAIADVMTRA